MAVPSLQEFQKFAEEYNVIPVWEEFMVDMDTPITIFKKVCLGDHTYLLESVEGGEQLARYSFMGTDPLLVFTSKGGRVRIETPEGEREEEGNPLEALERVMARYRVAPAPGLPRFHGGAVGYFGYDLVRHIEKLPEMAEDDRQLPDTYLVISRVVLIYDHVKHKLKMVVLAPGGGHGQAAYRQALDLLEELKARLRGPMPAAPPAIDGCCHIHGVNFSNAARGKTTTFTSNFTKESFMDSVVQAKEYIKAGDIFQVVLSQRLETEVTAHPFDIYRVLRTVNPSPYLYYLDFRDLKVIGSSPEMLVRVEDGVVQTMPIAGTRPRGRDEAEDRALADELLADAKERAEHLMLVDLGRNDLGRVCEFSSVRVKEFMAVHNYSHVMHLVSTVEGKLHPRKKAFDALASCFPAGTLSGAPKVRAMEIIEELEPTRRGPYGGAVGYISFNGNLDTCITIRTVLVRGNKAYVQAGAGIVNDSAPESEYEETMNKARALLTAITQAEEGL